MELIAREVLDVLDATTYWSGRQGRIVGVHVEAGAGDCVVTIKEKNASGKVLYYLTAISGESNESNISKNFADGFYCEVDASTDKCLVYIS